MKPTDIGTIDQSTLKSKYRYEPETGKWFHIVPIKTKNGLKTEAGFLSTSNGVRYLCISINGKTYKASRLAYFYMTGNWPANEIDHHNRDSLNNKWANLRPATRTKNNWNRGIFKNNSTGFTGVYRHNDKFRARITRFGKTVNLGVFTTAEEAGLAVRRKAMEFPP